jgi:hypothetical protein
VCGKTKKGKRSHEKQTKTLPQLFNIQGLTLLIQGLTLLTAPQSK